MIPQLDDSLTKHSIFLNFVSLAGQISDENRDRKPEEAMFIYPGIIPSFVLPDNEQK